MARRESPPRPAVQREELARRSNAKRGAAWTLWVLSAVALVATSATPQLPAGEHGVFVAHSAQAIQRALDAAGANGGGVVYLPAGTYMVERTIKVPSNVTLAGAGPATILVASETIGHNSYPDNRVIRNADEATGNSGVVVRDLTIDGALRGRYHQTGIYGICLSNCDNSRIEGVTVRRCSGEGILVSYGSGNIVIQRCIAELNNHGINVHHLTGEVLIRDCISRRNGTQEPEHGGIGIFIEAVRNVSICANVCLENAWAGIVWMGGERAEWGASDCVISNNICRANGHQGGIFVNGTYSETTRFLVTGNLCMLNGRDGIWALGASDGVISGNLCTSNNIPAGKDTSLEDWQQTASGIRLVNCSRVLVTGNRCLDERENKWQRYGICVEGNSSDNLLVGNITLGNGVDGIYVTEGNRVEDYANQ